MNQAVKYAHVVEPLRSCLSLNEDLVNGDIFVEGDVVVCL